MASHDRSEGEAVLLQEYTALKARILEWAPVAAILVANKGLKDANVFFIPATLRPETMYGQAVCFVGPHIVYGVFRASEHEYFVMTDQAARNMAFQGISALQVA